MSGESFDELELALTQRNIYKKSNDLFIAVSTPSIIYKPPTHSYFYTKNIIKIFNIYQYIYIYIYMVQLVGNPDAKVKGTLFANKLNATITTNPQLTQLTAAAAPNGSISSSSVITS